MGKSVIQALKNKVALYPNKQKHTIETVLITAHGAAPAVSESGYFTRILNLGDMFK